MTILKAMLNASAGLGNSSALYAPAGAGASDDNEPIGIIELDDNLADVEKPAELPAGTYEGEVQDVQTPTSGKGNKYFAIKFVIPPDEIPADLRDDFPDGATLYWNRQIVPTKNDRRAKYNLRRLIEALGLDSNTTSVDPNEWMGRRARLRVVMGKWQGEDRAEIRSIEAAERAPARAQAGKTRGRQEAETEREPAPTPRGRRSR